jgi:predicted glutamine amidotransferase
VGGEPSFVFRPGLSSKGSTFATNGVIAAILLVVTLFGLVASALVWLVSSTGHCQAPRRGWRACPLHLVTCPRGGTDGGFEPEMKWPSPVWWAMCRFVAYQGPPVRLHEMLYEPEHSLIHQSYHAHEREEPLNGDGWGVGWYDPRLEDWPATYRTLQPAWSDENMRHVSPLVETPTFFAHVRAASPGLPVHRLNCHPFRGGRHEHEETEDLAAEEAGRRRMMFMHNGGIETFQAIKRDLQEQLADDAYFTIDGSTDTEHLFALLQQELGEAAADPTVADMARALEATLTRVHELEREAGVQGETSANFCLTDGERMVATRYKRPTDKTPESLHVGTAGAFYCEGAGYGVQDRGAEDAVLITSERLWNDDRAWRTVPENHLVTVGPEHEVTFEPLDPAA